MAVPMAEARSSSLLPSGNGYTESVLYNFCSQSQGSTDCTDGVNPYAGLIEDASGNLYGTTNLGGTGVGLVNGGFGLWHGFHACAERQRLQLHCALQLLPPQCHRHSAPTALLPMPL